MAYDTFPNMTKVVPEGTHGIAELRHVTVTEHQSRMTAFGGGRKFVPAGTYAQLLINGSLMMSDTPYERRTNYPIVRHATGRVLIAGYGIGMVLTAVLKKPDVKEVVVVEIANDVVSLIDPAIRRRVGVRAAKKLKTIHADIFRARDRMFGKFDAMWFDIWGDCSTDTLAEMSMLTRRYRALKASKESFMECWDRKWLRYLKGQEQRAG